MAARRRATEILLLALAAVFIFVAVVTGQTSPRFEYCAVCPPSHRDDLNMTGCNITLLSRVDVDEITVATESGPQIVSLMANIPVTTTMDTSFIVNEGLEEKGIIISSDEELVVTVIKLDLETEDSRFVDAYQVYDRRLAGYEYYLLTKVNGCNDTDYVKSFFSVMSFEDSTFIEVYNTDGVFEGASVINRFQVYTQRTTEAGNDFSGMRVKLSKPALVVTGCMCAGNSYDGVTETYITSLQPTLFYGVEYVTPVIAGSITASYGLRVLATNTTEVTHEGATTTLRRGEFLEFEYEVNDLATNFRCSIPCLVIQWSDGRDIGNFMFNVFALSQFTQIASFITLDLAGDHWVSIVVAGFPPMDDIFLDDQNLFDETWKVRSSYSYTELPIERGLHKIHIDEGSSKTFGAYVYGHLADGLGGYGYSIFPQDLINLPTPPTTEITTPDPTDGYEYVAACPPHQGMANPQQSACEISITAATDEDVLVDISTVGSDMQVIVQQFLPHTLYLNHTMITTQGHENKAVVVRAASPLTVVVYKLDLSGENVFIDATQIYSLAVAGFEHYIMSPANGCPEEDRINSFYSLAGHWESTFVEIFDKQSVFIEAVVLNKFQVYTVMSTDKDVDYSGRYMRSIYPVTAIAGCLCMQDSTLNVNGTYFSSLPAIIHYGLNFTTPNMHEPSSGGYGLRVLASQDFTRISWEESGVAMSAVLSAGETATLDFTYEAFSRWVKCSRPCLVEQFTKSFTGRAIGNYMFNVIPTEQFYQEAYFTTSAYFQEQEYQHYISIVVLGLPPMMDIFLDGAHLNDAVTWRWFDEYTYTDLAVSPGRHVVTSTSAKKFAVYVYSHTEHGGGFGYPIWPQDMLFGSTGSPPTIAPTRAPLPSHVITINATSETSTGLAPEGSCDTYYRATMRLRGTEVSDDVNEGLGSSFCVAIEGNIVISAVEVYQLIVGSVVTMDIVFTIPGQQHHRAYQLETCAEEIAEYLVNMNNWQDPLVPGNDQIGCAPLDFSPRRFDLKSLMWQCASESHSKRHAEMYLELSDNDEVENVKSTDEGVLNYGLDTGDDHPDASDGPPHQPPPQQRVDNAIVFGSTLSQQLVTMDDSIMDQTCQDSYESVVEDMGADMVDYVNANRVTNCSDSTLLAVDTEFRPFRETASLSYHFTYEPGTESFQQLEDCFDDLEEFLVQHASWGDPLVPPVAECPDLVPQANGGDEFERGNTAWLCEG